MPVAPALTIMAASHTDTREFLVACLKVALQGSDDSLVADVADAAQACGINAATLQGLRVEVVKQQLFLTTGEAQALKRVCASMCRTANGEHRGRRSRGAREGGRQGAAAGLPHTHTHAMNTGAGPLLGHVTGKANAEGDPCVEPMGCRSAAPLPSVAAADLAGGRRPSC